MLAGRGDFLGGGICNLGFVFYNLLCGGLNEGREVGIMETGKERTGDSSRYRSRNNSRKRVFLEKCLVGFSWKKNVWKE